MRKKKDHRIEKQLTNHFGNYSLYSFFSVLLAFLSMAYIYFFFLGFSRNKTNVPYWDEWDVRINWSTHFNKLGISQLLELHNEHRPLLSYITFIIDNRFFQGNTGFLYIFNFALIALIAVLLILNFSRYRTKEMNENFLIYGISVCVFLFSLVGNENLYWGLESVFYTTLLIPMISFSLLETWKHKLSNQRIILITSIAALSSLTTAAGQMASFVVGFYFLLIIKNYKAGILNLAISAVVYILYHLNYPSENNSILFAAKHASLVIIYLLKFYLSPVYTGSKGNYLLSTLWGIIFSYCFYKYVQNIKKKTEFNSFAFLTIIYIAVSSVLISIGRLQFGTNQAFSSRYTIYPLVMFLTLIAEISRVPQKKKAKRKFLEISYLKISLLLFLVSTFPLQISSSQRQMQIQEQRQFAQLLIKYRIPDSAISAVYPDPLRAILVSKPYLQTESFNFGNSEFSYNQNNIDVKKESVTKKCLSHLDSIRQSNGDQKSEILRGWISDGKQKQKPGRILILDEVNRIIGLGFVGTERKDVAQALKIQDQYSGYDAVIFDRTNIGKNLNIIFEDGLCNATSPVI